MERALSTLGILACACASRDGVRRQTLIVVLLGLCLLTHAVPTVRRDTHISARVVVGDTTPNPLHNAPVTPPAHAPAKKRGLNPSAEQRRRLLVAMHDDMRAHAKRGL